MAHDHTFVGRSSEKITIDAVRDRVAGGRCEALLITGDSGIGKTHLAEATLSAPPLALATGKAFENTRPPYGPLIPIARACHAMAARPSTLPTFDGDLNNTLETLTALIESAAHHQPLALLIDDLQWADQATFDILPMLLDRLRRIPILIAATISEPHASHDPFIRHLRQELRRMRRLTTIRLDALDLECTRVLLEAELGDRPSSELVQRIHDRTQGHPLYVQEIAETLMHSTPLHDDALPLPESLRDTVTLRMADLDEASTAALEFLAVAGIDLPNDTLRALVNPDTHTLLKSGMAIEPKPGALALRHTLMADAIRNAIPHARRRERGAQLAAVLDPESTPREILAHLWTIAGELVRARDAYLELAHERRTAHAHGDAAHFFRQALTVWSENRKGHEHFETVRYAAECAQAVGDYDEAILA